MSKNFFMVQMGRDNLNVVDPVHYDALDNAERVAEVMHLLREGSNLGWPYAYWDPIKRARMLAPALEGRRLAQAPRHSATLSLNCRGPGGLTLTSRLRWGW